MSHEHLDEGPPRTKGKILLIEDSSSQAGLVKASLDRLGYQVIWAPSGMQGLAHAQNDLPDVVLLDVMLRDMDGFAVCRWLKMRPETRDIPVLMFSVRDEPKDRIQGLYAGACDYIVKPCVNEELEARIFAALRVRAAQTELKRRNTELEAMMRHVEAMAITDGLTGLFNRRRFVDVLRNQFAVTKRYKNPLSCIMLDIDHFKSINDQHGHEAGDRVLKAVAQKLSENLREVDVAARYGGEEYAILLPHTNKKNALVVADRILSVIRKVDVNLDGASISVTASLGLASSSDLSGKASPEDLVKAADTALYKAKEAGRDRAVAYDANELE